MSTEPELDGFTLILSVIVAGVVLVIVAAVWGAR
jgi:hypothetical protein